MNLSKAAEATAFLKDRPKHVRVVLIYGPDRARVRERALIVAKSQLDNPDDPFSSTQLALSDIDTDFARLEDELTAQSMLGGPRLVWLRIEGESKLGTQLADAAKFHADGAFNPDALFLIEAGNLGKESKLRQAIEKASNAAALPCYEPDAREISTLVRQHLQTSGVRISPDALDLLLGNLPGDMGVVQSELDKLSLYARPGEEIDRSDIEALMAASGEGDIFNAAFDALAGETKAAHTSLRKAFDAGEPAALAVRATSLHLMKLRRAAGLVAAGKTQSEAAKSLRIFWKQEKAFLGQMNVWTAERLVQAQYECRLAERRTKSTGQPAELITERLFLSLAGKAKRGR